MHVGMKSETETETETAKKIKTYSVFNNLNYIKVIDQTINSIVHQNNEFKSN